MIEYPREYHPGNYRENMPKANASVWIIDNEDGTGIEQQIAFGSGEVISETQIEIDMTELPEVEAPVDPVTQLKAEIAQKFNASLEEQGGQLSNAKLKKAFLDALE